jgi:hypothetical protein
MSLNRFLIMHKCHTIQPFGSLNRFLIKFIFVFKLLVDMFQLHTVHIYVSLPRLITCSDSSGATFRSFSLNDPLLNVVTFVSVNTYFDIYIFICISAHMVIISLN